MWTLRPSQAVPDSAAHPPLPAAAPHWRLPLLAAGILAMLAGIWGGLLRLGWPWPAHLPNTIANHGAIMIGGFLGTLLSLERAVALRRAWCYLGPISSAVGAALLIFGIATGVGSGLILLASIILIIDFIFIVHLQRALFTVTMAAGALAWFIGNVLWLSGWSIANLVFWWMGFLVLTIVGERLELSRLMPRTPGRSRLFIAALVVFLLGLGMTLFRIGLGEAIAGVGLLALAAWLLVFDVARRTIRQTGLTRFVAVCLLTGYFWLAVGGGLTVLWTSIIPVVHGHSWSWLSQAPAAGFRYDAILHAVFLGFVFGMIFGHAPIIFPAILGVRMQFSRRFYIPLILLQGSVAWRVIADCAASVPGRQWAGLFNALAIIAFLVSTVASIRTTVPPLPGGGQKRPAPGRDLSPPESIHQAKEL